MKVFRSNIIWNFCLWALFVVVLNGCFILGGGVSQKDGKQKGQLVGAPDRDGFEMAAQYGMVKIPTGKFYMGQADENIQLDQSNRNRQVTISAFYMDDTEITNNEYRQFIRYIEMNSQDGAEEGGAEEDADIGGPIYRIPDGYTLQDLKPDSTVWSTDFTHHYGDPLLAYYWSHPAFDDYPVVGVSWKSASEFTKWRSNFLNDYRKSKKLQPFPNFRLPTEAEWEYASRGGRDNVKYPWGNPYVRNSRGCVLANFKPGRGNYVDDGYAYTSPVGAFFPNDFGLYDMSGNVAEWCLDAYIDEYTPITWDLNPVFRNDTINEKVIRGGSWKDIAFFIEVATRTYEHQDTVRAFIGFRTALPHLGRSYDNF